MNVAPVNGILLLDKPLGMSSAAAVARAKRVFAALKAGHTGSLDPLASGMLPVCFGEATKFGALMLDASKTYRMTVRLGERTLSADRETEVLERHELPPFSREDMQSALAAFPREYSQVPPMRSAIKQEGRPLYEYARAGIIRERTARLILIHSLCLLDWDPPDLTLEVHCTKGAYMRVLAEDIAARLGTVGHLAVLRRVSVANFCSEPQWSFEALDSMSPAQRRALLLPVDAALASCRKFDLSAAVAGAFLRGQAVTVAQTMPETVRVYADGRGFVGLGGIESEGRLVPLRLISSELPIPA